MQESERLTRRQRRELRRQERRTESTQTKRSSQQKRVLIWILVFGVLVAGGWVLFSSGTTDVSGTEIDPSTGPDTATVVIEEFSDFQCPACKAALGPLEQIVREYSDQVRLVYNDFPLASLHKNAQVAAEAALCANDQGKFWAYHDVLFERQEEWASLENPRDSFILYAQELGLDQARFTSCVDDRTFKGSVNRDSAEGLRRRVNSTPSFFVNGELVRGGQTVDQWRQLLQEQGVTNPTIAPADSGTDTPPADDVNTSTNSGT